MANFFPRWSNLLPLKIAVCAVVTGIGVTLGFAYYATPKAMVVGYEPTQPIPFSHKIHADQLGMDCRYCHSFVDVSGHSNLPTSNVCWNCHSNVQTESPKLQPLRNRMDASLEHADFGKPIEWVRVHKLPDYVYFNHSAHVNRGVSCQSCHGDVDQMEVVYQHEPLSMGWCLDCHRAPEKFVRPLEEVFNFKYDAEKFVKANPQLGLRNADKLGEMLVDHYHLTPKETCATCHH